MARGPELVSLEEEPGGGWPAPLSEVAGWQDRVERHVMEDLGSVYSFVQILDLLVPQSAEQLVEVPTLLSPTRIALRTVEQIVDISSSGGTLGHGSASSAGAADDDSTWFFALFPMEKSAECRAGGECAAGWARQLIHAEHSSNG